MTDLAAYVARLQAALERSWAARGYELGVFPELAALTLAASNPGGAFSLAELLEYVFCPPSTGLLPALHPAPEVFSLAHGPHFDIRAHVWADNIAIPHSHEWAGAFAIISGSSVNAHYRFHEHAELHPSLVVGELERVEVRRLSRGDVVPVERGTFIHGLVHLDRPGLALSVRASVSSATPRTYLRPGVGFSLDTQASDTPRKLRALATAHSLDPALFARLSAAAFADDPGFAYLVACEAAQHDWALEPAALAAATRLFGRHFDQLWQGLDELRRYQRLVELRTETADPGLRWFLAALYLADDRPSLLAQLEGQRVGPERLGHWLAQLLIELDDDEPALALVVEVLGHAAMGLQPGPLARAAKASHEPETQAQLDLCAAALDLIADDPLLAMAGP